MKCKKSKILLAAVLACSVLSLTGCNTNTATESGVTADGQPVIDAATKEIRQNDYRGGVMRLKALQTNIFSVMEAMKANNVIIRQDSPNSFWTADGYQDFVSTFLDTAIIDDTQWFNEEETDWDAIINQMVTTPNSFSDLSGDSPKFKSGISVVKNEKDDYSVLGVPMVFSITLDNKLYSTDANGKANYRVLYDCDKDWCKSYAQVTILDGYPASTFELFEYQRIDDNTFVVQTGRERLMVVLAPAEADTDIRERQIKEFYYSKLVNDGMRTTFEPFELLPETDKNDIVLRENIKLNEDMVNSYPFLNLNGDLCSRYGINDSMFLIQPGEMTRDWVFEDEALQQGIVYKDGILVVTTYNKLSTYYERFIYSRADADTSGLQELENLVQIDNLVGVQNVEIVDTKPTESNGNSSTGTSDTSEDTSSTSEEENTSDTTAVSNSDESSTDSTAETA